MSAKSRDASAVRLRVGVSACLLGERVRYDSGHKQDRWVTDVLGRFVEFVPVCPEVEIGLGVPREPIRLEGAGSRLRLVAPKSGADFTRTMSAYAEARAEKLSREHLCGFILKKDSPSCGLLRVRVYDRNGAASRRGRGLFAEALVERFPALPVEEEGRLNDARLRENFVTRIFAHRRWLELEQAGLGRARLFRFHEQHKFLLLAHNQVAMRRLGHLLGDAGKRASDREIAARYLELFTEAMARVPTARNHANALQHIAGFFSERLDPGDRAELARTIDEYRRGHLPLVVPLVLVRHYVRKLEVPYLLDQVYLNPHPDELMLLNHV